LDFKINSKEILVKAGLVLFGIIVFLLFFEVFLRITTETVTAGVGAAPVCIHREAEITAYRFKPNAESFTKHLEYEYSYSTNSHGFRDSELLANPAYRIVGVGDSFTFGQGVENNDVYLNVAEREINVGNENQIEIVNAGIGGFNNEDAYNYVLEFNEEIDYDMLVFAIFLGNDVVDNLQENPRKVNEDGCLVRVTNEEEKKQPTFREFLYQNFYVVRFFSRARQLEPVNQFVVAIGLGSKGEDNPNFNLLRKEKDEKSLKAIEKTKEILLQVKEFSQANEKKLLVLLIPSKYQVYDGIFQEDMKKYLAEENTVDNMEVNNILRSFFESNNIDYFDSTDSMREFSSEMLYYEKDGHLNVLGHEVLGKALAQKLENEI